MYTIGVTLFLIIAVLQTLVILMQSSKGGGLAGSFGAGGMGAVFGSRGTATFLSKLTAGLAIGFMVLALFLGFLKSGSSGARSLVEQERQERTSSPAAVGVPVIPGAQNPPANPPPSQPSDPNQPQ
ncbi:MAG: preprotein translocase subunit SecG [bacterium]